MIEQELQKIWQDATTAERVLFNRTILLKELDNAVCSFEKGIRKRDRREIAVAVLLMPALAIIAYLIPFILSKVAMLLLIPWCLLVIYQLKRIKKENPDHVDMPLTGYLINKLQYVDRQKKLLQSVLYWYILPPSVLCILFFLGFNLPPGRLAIHIIIVLAVNMAILYLNMKAVKEDLEPLRHKLNETLKQLQTDQENYQG
jgi:hypothetical protein